MVEENKGLWAVTRKDSIAIMWNGKQILELQAWDFNNHIYLSFPETIEKCEVTYSEPTKIKTISYHMENVKDDKS